MEKMRMETMDMVNHNVALLQKLFPACVVERKDKDGTIHLSVDFDKLRQLLSDEVIEGTERYEMTWVGKKAAIVETNRPIRKTLRPVISESKGWDSTENLYIEGDNLDTLKLLQESYL